MNPIKCILIFDIGKTNKKVLLYNEQYEVVYEDAIQLKEIEDEDRFPCEDIAALTSWVKNNVESLQANAQFTVKAIHYSAYGASFVYLDEQGNVIAPLYNYLKPYNASTKLQFESNYGSIENICLETASPNLDNLNSGLQLYRLKIEQPLLYSKIKWALHLPQYIHYIITGEIASDITSVGCHTLLWDFKSNQYHAWVMKEGIDKILPPIKEKVGLHDSSAAIIPYLSAFSEPFVLISTGTWCISLNPFNETALANEEMELDTLCYMSYEGKPVKASRLFAGKEHEVGLKEITEMYNNQDDFDAAYKKLMDEIVQKQIKSTNLILCNSNVKRIFVDGGFSKNEHYMQGLANGYPEIEIYAATIPQASSLGAALVIHENWNNQSKFTNLIELKLYQNKTFPN